MSRRIALVVGDTPGHFYPALAVAEAYGRAVPATDVLFCGPATEIAASLAARHGCAYQRVSSSQMKRVGIGGKGAAVAQTLRGTLQARNALRRHGAEMVIGFGSYASGPVVLAARTLGVRTAIHEGNVWPGLANRWLGRLADRVYVNFDDAARWFPRDRRRLVGWPVRHEVDRLSRIARDAPSSDRPARILVLAGVSPEIARFLNSRVPALAGLLARRGLDIEVRHQAPVADEPSLTEAYRRAGVRATVTSLIDPIDDAYRWSDFVIARAGAGTIAELAAAGLPALLVPFREAADDHQALNARAFADAGGGFWIREEAWNADDLAARISALLFDPPTWTAASAGARRLARPDAADQIVADCEGLIRARA